MPGDRAGATNREGTLAAVRIVSAAVTHPPHWLSQDEAASRIGALTGEVRRAAAIARGSDIARRAIVLPPDEIVSLDSTAARNAQYRSIAPGLAQTAAAQALGESPRGAVRCIVTSSCTGSMLPGWAGSVVETLGLPRDIMRTPITESGCAGGVVALARAADYLGARPGSLGLIVATELCSLAFQATAEGGALTASLIFGDGAGACALSATPGPGLRIIDAASDLVPHTENLLGFDLTDHGFYPIVSRELPERVVPAALAAIDRLLCANGLAAHDVSAWLVHPGGARILDLLEQQGTIPRDRLRWSRESLAQCGNMSSAAIVDVIRRYLDDRSAVEGPAVIVGIGPGVAIELLLVERRR